MHSPHCKSNVVIATYPPIYQACDCGYDNPEVYASPISLFNDGYAVGYEKGLRDCYYILMNKDFMTEDGRWTLAVDALRECMSEINKLFGEG